MSKKTNILFCLYIGIIISYLVACKPYISVKEPQSLQDSIEMYNDTTRFIVTFLKNGNASWYGGTEWDGCLTHSGDTFSSIKCTAASATIPMGTFLKVTNLRNKRVAFVKVNDTFPAWNTRDLDLSLAAAQRLDMIDEGVAKVKIEKVESKY